MEIPESQWGIIWKAIKYWMGEYHLSPHVFSLQIAGTRPPYPPDRIAKGIEDSSERVTSDLLHRCVRIFGLVSARQRGLDDKLTDEECIGLLTAPLVKNNDQGKFQL
jgi:hypothetical protein